MTHPMLPTQEQFAEWDSQYFDGEGQNFDFMMLKAFQAGADCQLEQVIEWLSYNLGIFEMEDERYIYIKEDFLSNTCINEDKVIEDLKKAMRPQQQEDN
jgi:hypothetical protein